MQDDGGCGGGAGLPPGQRVLTPDGYRPVAAIDVRDRIVTGVGRERLLIGLRVRPAAALVRLVTAAGLVLRAAAEQPVLARRQEGVPAWIAAGQLAPGDLAAFLGCARGPGRAAPVAGCAVAVAAAVGLDWLVVAGASRVPYDGPVYTLDVEEDHSCVSEGWVLAATRGA
jgi:hypothetical protein